MTTRGTTGVAAGSCDRDAYDGLVKKFLKFLVLVGVLAALGWYARNKMVPPPQSAAGSPPPFRVPDHPPAAAPEAPAVDDLTDVKGIGPVYSSKLVDRGITTFGQLAAADADDIAADLEVTVDEVRSWQQQASELA